MLKVIVQVNHVAPFVGAWIEIFNNCHNYNPNKSLRSSERGLKFDGQIAEKERDSRSVRRSVD